MAKAIRVENLSKAYQLGDFGTGTISRDLERFLAKLRGKEDPFLKIGEVNDRTTRGQSDIVWSLKDLNFDIEQGNAIGIIGRNGAGKSTLLKILSRVTSPTTGSIKVKGRIASLLEVGTGFHPELTGRENIYLNGSILGMRKTEIRRKFDEIVDFAGVERFVDTPVKRYSSGMYVRLAFAVAAHLESEILIIDEVLAVGDVAFQKKCLGKMGHVSKDEGRTVLFVSHNMGMINQLCDKTIYLRDGMILRYTDTASAISEYLSENEVNNRKILDIKFTNEESDNRIRLTDFSATPHFIKSNDFLSDKPIKINVNLSIEEPCIGLRIGFEICSATTEDCVFRTFHDDSYTEIKALDRGNLNLTAFIPENLLNTGEYAIYPVAGIHNVKWLTFKKHKIIINVINVKGINNIYADHRPGIISPYINWEISYEIY